MFERQRFTARIRVEDKKIAQIIIARLDGKNINKKFNYYQSLVKKGIGGFIIFGGKLKEVSRAIKRLQNYTEIPLFIASDLEQGLGQHVEGGTLFPPAMAIGQAINQKNRNDIALLRKSISIIAQETKAAGINTIFAPVLDVNTNIKNPVIGDRSFSHNPSRVAQLGTALICGLQENGIIACGKHFPGHGDTYRDSHTSLPTLPHTMARLETIELVPFIAAIEAGVRSIMTAHIIFDGIDHNMPATMSVPIIGKLLRQDLNYNGVVFTDDLNMSAISKKWTLSEACLNSLQAGCDICLICRDNARQKEAIEYVANAAASGKLPESLIKTAYRRISTKLFDFIEK